jgi:hypothetical protein
MGRRAKKKPLRWRIVPKPDTHVKQKRARKHNKTGKMEKMLRDSYLRDNRVSVLRLGRGGV